MRTLSSFATVIVSIIALVACTSQNEQSNSEWINLFEKDNLDDWIVKIKGYEIDDNYANTFKMENGILKVRYDKEAYSTFENRFGHIFYKEPFSHYILQVEYRFVGEQCTGAPGWAFRNSGIMLHGQTPESMQIEQDFPVSIEFQLLGSDSTREQVTGSVCTPGTNIVIEDELILDHCTQSNSKIYMDDQWVTAEVEVRGNEIIKHIINGDTVMVYSQPQLDNRDEYFDKMVALNEGNIQLSKGTISLQSEGHPCDFRNLRIKVLEK